MKWLPDGTPPYSRRVFVCSMKRAGTTSPMSSPSQNNAGILASLIDETLSSASSRQLRTTSFAGYRRPRAPIAVRGARVSRTGRPRGRGTSSCCSSDCWQQPCLSCTCGGGTLRRDRQIPGRLFFVWILWTLGGLGGFTLILSARAANCDAGSVLTVESKEAACRTSHTAC
jgi:hypothetical protein